RGKVRREQVHIGLVGHLLDVGAGRESLFGTRDDDAGNALVSLERIESRAEVRAHPRVERVQGLRAVEPHDADLALGLDQNGFVGHRNPAVRALVWARGRGTATSSARDTGNRAPGALAASTTEPAGTAISTNFPRDNKFSACQEPAQGGRVEGQT